MHDSPRLRSLAPALVWVVGWLAAGPAPAPAAPPPPPAVLMGAVVRAHDGVAVSYANVVDTTTRIGTITDERGGFRLSGLPAGRRVIRVQSLGSPPLHETLELAPGDSARRTYRLGAPAHDRFLQLRDSLAAIGRWPPTLEPGLRAHMREALDIRVFRLDPDHPVFDAPPDPGRIGPWPIIAEVPPPERALIDELIATLGEPELYLSRLQGAVKVCGGFAPVIDVRFTSTGVPVDVLLCHQCGEFSIWSGGQGRQAGDFQSQGPFFVRFAQRLFPRDPLIKKLGAKPGRRSR